MAEPSHKEPGDPGTEFARRIGEHASRKLRARRRKTPGLWFGLGMMGVVGWSIAIPTLLGAALGRWLDHHEPQGHSWTLALLLAGLTIGCLNAWFWVNKEERAMREEDREEGDD